jgi:molybdopterin-containing oxidoreductase family iron-sulfur binding subunit
MKKPAGRRQFIAYSGALLGLALLGKFTAPLLASRRNEPGGEPRPPAHREKTADGTGTIADATKKFSMVIDVGACIGCRKCQWACKEENNIPDTIAPPWIEVFEMKDEVELTSEPSHEDLTTGATTAYSQSPREGHWYLPTACHHCDNPPCVKVCPVGATYKDKDGIVLMDYKRCIGCRICVVACPYSARRFNWLKPEVPAAQVNPLVPVRPLSVVEKCTFCVHRVRRGRLPRCVEVCPVQARHFGDLNDPESHPNKMLRTNRGVRLLSDLNTHPNIIYVTRGKKWYE